MRTTGTLLLAAMVLAGLGSCATTASPQLVEARNAYATSSAGIDVKLTPTELNDARMALNKAEAEFKDNGDTNACRDYAYIALRKVQLADTKARTEVDRQTIAAAAKAGVVVRDTQVKNAQASLASTRQQLKDERRDAKTGELVAANVAQGKELDKKSAELESEKAGRLSAETKLAGAMKDIATLASVKEETRGVVITLSGSVLFASGRSTLLETARNKLDHVAVALKAQDDDKRMVVEGHTDSRGSDSTNQPLSLDRANAVRDYLVSQGVAQDRIKAVGMGSTRPILDNRSSENRANNRRVEIVISSSPVSAL